MAEGDSALVVQFDTQVETLVDTTTDRAALTTAIQGITPRSDTALYDAIAAGVAAAPECGRRAVVTMTDARDTASTQFGLDQTIGQTNATNTPVFVVGLETSQFTPEVLNRVATDTGAQYFQAPTPADLDELYRQVDSQLAGQYVIRFAFGLEPTGAERRLAITANAEGSPTLGERSFVY